MRADVAIIGGGIMGSALAYWLTRLQPGMEVRVLERDPTYRAASSALSAASIRQQFSTAVNVRISQASIEFLRSAGEQLQTDDERPDIGLREQGYLYLATPAGVNALRQAHELQTRLGAHVAWFDAPGLASNFPWLHTGDLAAGTLGLSGEGWFDGYTLLNALGRKARAQGAKFVRGEVIRVDARGARIDSIALADGTQISAAEVVNAAGPWARAVGRLAGIDLPVFARRRTVCVLTCPAALPRLPLVIDPSGFWIRPEGGGYIAGFPPEEDPDEPPLEPQHAQFESTLWPALAARIPAFESARLERAWAGYYEMNTFDHNGIVGRHPVVTNLLLMNGFSGHGFQQAPVVGRAVAELILHGRFIALDLSELRFERVLAGEPLRELNII